MTHFIMYYYESHINARIGIWRKRLDRPTVRVGVECIRIIGTIGTIGISGCDDPC